MKPLPDYRSSSIERANATIARAFGEPDFSRPAVEENGHGATVINWTTADLFLPFSEGGPTMAERARILKEWGA